MRVKYGPQVGSSCVHRPSYVDDVGSYLLPFLSAVVSPAAGAREQHSGDAVSCGTAYLSVERPAEGRPAPRTRANLGGT